jgi:hypothetical protein
LLKQSQTVRGFEDGSNVGQLSEKTADHISHQRAYEAGRVASLEVRDNRYACF